ncbi:MAG: beta-lactamase family protein [Sphingomonadaceae bacterium]|nr:beta-lactamase family protein [Sphingomonadaceae bacterium]
MTISLADPKDYGFLPDRLARIPAFLKEKYLDSGKLPHAALLVARAGDVVHLSMQGDGRDGVPIAEDSIYRIASMTKPITSILFMMLVEEGKVALSHKVANFLPEFEQTGVFLAGGGGRPFDTRPPANPMTMLDLLRHTSGLTYGFQERTPVDAAYRKTKIDDFHSERSLDQFIAELAALPLEFDPGSCWNYSLSTDVLGAVIQRIEGKPFAQVAQERLFDPLGMVDTHFVVPRDKADRIVDAFAFHPKDRMTPFDSGARSRWMAENRMASGGGGLASTIGDYHRFCSMLVGGGAYNGQQIISPKTLELMTANHLPGGGDLTQHSKSLFSESENAGVGFGLGFACTMEPHLTLMPGSAGEFYWGGMFSTGFFIDPVEQIHMVFMTQLMPSSTYPVRREIKSMIYAALAA